MNALVVLAFSLAIFGAFLTSGGNIEPLWFGQSSLSPLFLGLAVLPLIWGIWVLGSQNKLVIQLHELIVPFVLVVSLVFAPFTLNANIHIVQIIIWFVFWINAVLMLKLISHCAVSLERILFYILSSSFIFLLITLITAFSNQQLRFGEHLSGIYGLHNSFAATIMYSCTICLFTLIHKFPLEQINQSIKLNSKHFQMINLLKPLAFITLILGLIAIFFSQSRGVWICLALQIIVFIGYFLFSTKSSLLKLPLTITFLVTAIMFVFIPSRYKQHVLNAFNRADFSVMGRVRFHQVAAEMSYTPPLVGYGNYRFRYPSLQKDPNYYATDPHDLYMQIISEGQWLGVVLLSAILFSVIFAIKKRQHLTPARMVVVSGLIASAVHLAIDFDFTFTSNGLLFGLLWALWQLPDNKTVDSQTPSKIDKVLNISIAIVLIIIGFYSGLNITSIHFSRLSENSQHTDKEQLANFAIQLNPIDQKAWRSLAFASSSQDVSLRAFKRINQLSPMDARAWNETGSALELANTNPDRHTENEIISCYLRSIQCDPVNRPYLYYDLAQFYKLIGQERDQLNTLQAMLLAFNWSSPITPDHPRPQWINYNSMMLEVMQAIVSLESKWNNNTQLTEVCLQRIPLFEDYLKNQQTF